MLYTKKKQFWTIQRAMSRLNCPWTIQPILDNAAGYVPFELSKFGQFSRKIARWTFWTNQRATCARKPLCPRPDLP
jgi:hypothetical protein